MWCFSSVRSRKKKVKDKIFPCLGFHRWIYGDYQIGEVSKYTGDLIGRTERHCIKCPAKEISTSQFSKEHRKELREEYGDFLYLRFEYGDKLDKKTKKWLIGK